MKKITLSILLVTVCSVAFAQWTTSGTNIYNSNAGSVGIGALTPYQKFTINGNLGIYGPGLDGSVLQHSTIYSDVTHGLLVEAPQNSSGNKLDVTFSWRGTGAPTALFIKGSSANVGVNNTTPFQKFTVNGNLGIYGPGLDGSQLQHTAIYSDATYGLLFEGPKNASGNKLDISFNWRGGGTTPLMIKGSTGNVGIGSASPDEKLTVKGKIHAEEVKVDLTVPGPDYVFDKDYSLMPLSEVETYVNTHKHLPEVPSSDEMMTNGLNMKELNLLLLKKVEELTLHLIEANKKIDGLSEEVKGLKNK